MNAQERRVYFALALGFLALLIACASAFFAVRGLVAQTLLVDHSHQVRIKLLQLLATHQDVETGERGYVITGNPDYLRPYQSARDNADQVVAELAELVADAPAQAERLTLIRGLHDNQIRQAEQIVEARRQDGPGAAQRLVEEGEGKRLMDALRIAVAEMDADAVGLLAERSRQERSASTRLNWTLLASGLFALLVVAFGGGIIHRDFRQRRHAEEIILGQNFLLDYRVRESEARFRLLMDGVKDYAITMLDPQGLVVAWNLGAERLKGYAEGEILGKPMAGFYTQEDCADGKPARLLARAAAKGRCEDESWLLRKDGTRFLASEIITPMCDEAGELIGFAKITRDITTNRQAEETIRRHSHEQHAVNDELMRFNNSMVDRELRMIELKREINSLCRQLGQPQPYDLDFDKAEA